MMQPIQSYHETRKDARACMRARALGSVHLTVEHRSALKKQHRPSKVRQVQNPEPAWIPGGKSF